MIRLLELFSEYDKFKLKSQREKKKKLEEISSEEYQSDVVEFSKLFREYQVSENKDELEGYERIKNIFTEDKVKRFGNLIQELNDEDIAKVIKETLMDIEKQERMKAVTQQKEKENKKGFFSWGSKKSDTGLNADDMEEINKYIADTFQTNEESSNQLDNLAYQSQYHFEFTLKGGKFYFCDVTDDGTEEGIALAYKMLQAKIDMSNKGKVVSITLNDYSVDMLTKYVKSTSYIVVPIIRRVTFWKQSTVDSNILDLIFEQNPQGKSEGTYIDLNTKAVEIIFRPMAIERLTNFFNVSSEDENLTPIGRGSPIGI